MPIEVRNDASAAAIGQGAAYAGYGKWIQQQLENQQKAAQLQLEAARINQQAQSSARDAALRQQQMELGAQQNQADWWQKGYLGELGISRDLALQQMRGQQSQDDLQARYQLQAQLQNVELTQTERMRLERMRNNIGIITQANEDGELDDATAADAIERLQTGIDPLHRRLVQSQIQSQEQQRQQRETQMQEQTRLLQQHQQMTTAFFAQANVSGAEHRLEQMRNAYPGDMADEADIVGWQSAMQDAQKELDDAKNTAANSPLPMVRDPYGRLTQLGLDLKPLFPLRPEPRDPNEVTSAMVDRIQQTATTQVANQLRQFQQAANRPGVTPRQADALRPAWLPPPLPNESDEARRERVQSAERAEIQRLVRDRRSALSLEDNSTPAPLSPSQQLQGFVEAMQRLRRPPAVAPPAPGMRPAPGAPPASFDFRDSGQ